MSDGQNLKTNKYNIPDELVRRIQADTFRTFANSERLALISTGEGDIDEEDLDNLLLTLADELEIYEDGIYE